MAERTGLLLGTGCLAALAGPVLGIGVAQLTGTVIGDSWGYCMGVSAGYAAELAGGGPMGHFFEAIAFLLMYLFAFPAGFLAVTLSTQRAPRLGLAVLAGLGLLLGGASFDLALHLVPPDGYYLAARCPHGHPPWWPPMIPLPDHGPPNGFENRG
ncbi:hypothetical protein [Kitasatospora paranensis]|uniref:Uncharacterized protein n=1 Tax=Kitasatospora paranensis TaxID=258053 RepID=A0ABW2G9R6_9ACTN